MMTYSLQGKLLARVRAPLRCRLYKHRAKAPSLALKKAPSVFVSSSGHLSAGTSTALHLSKSLSAVGTRCKVHEKFAGLGSMRSVPGGAQVWRSSRLMGGETMIFTASAALGGQAWAPEALGALEGVEPGVLSGCPAGMRPSRRAGLAYRLENLLQTVSSKSRCQARQGRRPAGPACPQPSTRPAGGDTPRTRARCSLIWVEPTRLIVRLLTAENKPPALAIYWAGDEAVTGHPVPSAPQGGEQRETVSAPHLRKTPQELPAASLTSGAANASGSPENCRCRTLPRGLDVPTQVPSASPPHHSPPQSPQKQKSPLRSPSRQLSPRRPSGSHRGSTWLVGRHCAEGTRPPVLPRGRDRCCPTGAHA